MSFCCVASACTRGFTISCSRYPLFEGLDNIGKVEDLSFQFKHFRSRLVKLLLKLYVSAFEKSHLALQSFDA